MRFLGKDPNSLNNGSPTLWEDGDDIVVQGWKLTAADRTEIGEVSAHEDVVRIPKRMLQFLPEVRGGSNHG